MKKFYQLFVKFFLLIVILFLVSPFTQADYIYVACSDGQNGTIEKLDTSGNRTTFASGLWNPEGLAFDDSGNLYVSNYDVIEKIDSSGSRSLFALGLRRPIGMEFDKSGNLYVACSDGQNGTIEKLDTSGNRTTFASGLWNPEGLAFDNSGNLYVSNYDVIEKIDSSGNRSLFALGLRRPIGMVVQVPEPATLLLLGLGAVLLRRKG
ncbi:MAG: PEP-CTERM sorting domain-containing protein [Planctomycetota bacterium]|nr:PEP-CTERM sorting domain-containing protein [Planctomycetota bacterium]